MDGATNIFEVFQLYNGETWIFPLFLAAVAYLILRLDSRLRRNAVLMIVSACLFVFNEGIFRLASKISDIETFYRMIWMIPVVPILAYVMVDMVVIQKKWYRKILAAAAAVFAVVFAGIPYLNADSFKLPEEIQYLDENVAEICNIISQDKEEEYPVVACDPTLVMSLRLQDPTICYSITRDIYRFDDQLPMAGRWRKLQHYLLMIVNGEEVSERLMRVVLYFSRTNYVIIENRYNRDEAMQEANCRIVAKTDKYTIYRKNPPADL